MLTQQNIINLVAIAGIFLLSCFSIYKNKLTITGGIWAALISICILVGLGYKFVILLGIFFLLGTWATSNAKQYKAALQGNTEHPELRDAYQVLANGGITGLCGLAAWIFPVYGFMLQVMGAASLAAATADTLSSELGTVYGKKFYDIITFKPGQRGKDGIISVEGTLIGFIGAAIIALSYALLKEIYLYAAIVFVAGIFGNYIDSVLGATLERKSIIGNNLVNTLMTASAAFLASLYFLL